MIAIEILGDVYCEMEVQVISGEWKICKKVTGKVTAKKRQIDGSCNMK